MEEELATTEEEEEVELKTVTIEDVDVDVQVDAAPPQVVTLSTLLLPASSHGPAGRRRDARPAG